MPMKKLLAFSLLLGVAALVAFAAPAPRVSAESAKQDSHYTGGFWSPSSKNGPFASMYGDSSRAWLGVMRSQSSKGFEFAVIAEKGEAAPRFQIIDEQGNYHSVPVTALLKLNDKPAAKSPSDAPVAAKDDIPRGYKVIYSIARTRAAGELARKENISRAAAREKIDSISDKELHGAMKEAGLISPIKDYPGEGKLKAIIDWLIENQELILAVVTLLLSLFM